MPIIKNLDGIIYKLASKLFSIMMGYTEFSCLSEMDNSNNNSWRSNLPKDTRQMIVRRIADALQQTSFLQDHVLSFEGRIFLTATDEQNYKQRIARLLFNLEKRAQAATIQGEPRYPAEAVTSQDPGAATLMQNCAQTLNCGVPSPGVVSGHAQQRRRLSAQPLHLKSLIDFNVKQSSTGTGSSRPDINLIAKRILHQQSQQHRQQYQRQEQQEPRQQLLELEGVENFNEDDPHWQSFLDYVANWDTSSPNADQPP